MTEHDGGGEDPRPDLEAIYVEHRALLLHIAIRWFRIPKSEAEALAHNIFLSYVGKEQQVRSLRPWLVGAMVHASQAYWKRQLRLEPLPDGVEEIPDAATLDLPDSLDRTLTMRQVFAQLSDKCRDLLLIRYYDEQSLAEIASARRTTVGYAKLAVHRCLKHLRQLYHRVTKARP